MNHRHLWGSPSNVAEDLCPLGCDTLLLGEQFLTFQRNTAPLSSKIKFSVECLQLNMKTPKSFQMSGSTQPTA